jgi:hypothetical protein
LAKEFSIALMLVVTSDTLDPDEITEVLGIQPDRVARKGIATRPKAAPAKRNVWWLWSPCDGAQSSVRTQWLALKKHLQGREQRFRTLPNEAECELVIVVEAHQYMPAVEVLTEEMAEFVACGLKVVISIYDFIESPNAEFDA